ncbi:MAG: Glu/Leu/Phe/Val dehydrogenase [Gammaproteobacteria bacterium]|nr:Glu/Leu/Phe/Val dehydrogenase [Gammaproteobacteria bacterium]MBQ0839164.1 Glu/Leu/Phe/Val dehydrogenase [Gammaproteobacteria bacterium]
MFETLSQYGLSDIHLMSDETSGLQAIIAIHDTTLGPAIGGCRYLHYPCEQAAVEDAARLAQGMSYKAALAGLPFGGGKAVIIKPATENHRERLFATMGDFIASLNGRYITALDSGSTLQDMDIMAARTPFVSSSSAIGDCSLYTAEGLYSGIIEAFKIRFASDSLQQARIAIQGLGHVGMALAKRLHRAGASLIVSDLDPSKTACARQHFKARVVASDAICQQDCDVFSPCGLGGIINASSIPQLRCAIIAGAANNQLAAEGDDQSLRERGILYVPDFAINAGGLIYASMRFAGKPQARIDEKLLCIPATIRELLSGGRGKAQTPMQTALLMAQQRIAAGHRKIAASAELNPASSPGQQSSLRA